MQNLKSACARFGLSFPFCPMLHQDSYTLNSPCMLSPTSPPSLSCRPACSFGDEPPPKLTYYHHHLFSYDPSSPAPATKQRPPGHLLPWNQVLPTTAAWICPSRAPMLSMACFRLVCREFRQRQPPQCGIPSAPRPSISMGRAEGEYCTEDDVHVCNV